MDVFFIHPFLFLTRSLDNNNAILLEIKASGRALALALVLCTTPCTHPPKVILAHEINFLHLAIRIY